MHFTILLEVPANGGYLGRNLILVIGAYMAAENASQLIGIVTLLAAAVVAVPLFKRIGLGSVLGYLNRPGFLGDLTF